MFDARDLLGRLFDSEIAKSAKDRLDHAIGPGGLTGASEQFSELFSKVSGQARTGLGGLADEAEGFYGKAKEAVQQGSPLAIGGLAAIAGAVLGGGGGAVRGALGGGLLAVLGSIAMKALTNQDTTPGGEGTAAGETVPTAVSAPAGDAGEETQQATARLMIRAMIEAAKADGTIDEQEKARILGKLEESGADEAQRAFVLEEMQKPLDLDGLVRDVPDRAVGVQVYAASLLAIEVDTPAEEDYLRRLAEALGLDAAAIEGVHQALGIK